MKYKALISDFDKTLIVHEGKGEKLTLPSERVTTSIRKAGEKVAIGIATSRAYIQVAHVFDYLQLAAPCITSGGAQVIDPITKNILYERLLAKDDVTKIGNIALKLGLPTFLDDNDNVVAYTLQIKINKPLCLFTESISQELSEVFMEELKAFSNIEAQKITSYIPGEFYITINHLEATKQHGILEVAKVLGISPHEIIGIGDSHNDFLLLMACGLRVAMGNAVPELKEIADYIAPGVEEDGVADVIERFILNQTTSQ